MTSAELLSSPPEVLDQLPLKEASNWSSTGFAVMSRTVPAIELAPYRVP